jgi:glutathione S-transferase
MSITFYYSPMSSATRVHWALEELGLPFEKVKIDLGAGDHKKPAYLALNPNGKIPLLVVDGKPIFESLAQLLFLGETYGVDMGLFPKPGMERAEAFKWMAWGSVSVVEVLARIIKNGERVPEDQRNPKAREVALKEARELLVILDAHLAGREYVASDAFSLVDVALGSFMPFAGRLGVDTNDLPNLQAWVGRIMARPALARAMQG